MPPALAALLIPIAVILLAVAPFANRATAGMHVAAALLAALATISLLVAYLTYS